MDVEAVLAGRYPAKAHARRVVEHMRKKDSIGRNTASTSQDAEDQDMLQDRRWKGILYLEGQKTKMIEDNDETIPFRQRRYPEAVIWSGLPLSPEEALQLYDIDDCLTADDISEYIKSKSFVFAIPEQISGPVQDDFRACGKDHQKRFDLDTKVLKAAIEECRVIKDDYEVALTRKANAISTIAHTAVLRAVKRAKNERELEALFLQQCIANGCREQAYHSIVASGTAAATLHYVKNYEPLAGKQNLLLDAGGEYNCYASDITRTFPINGTFSKESREIYTIVLQMQSVCTAMLREGIVWDDVHLMAHKIAIEGLLDLGILKGDKEAILFARTSVAFFPHGLGHYLGMDTHDTGGNPNYADKDTMFRYLRVRGQLPSGSIITVEPGIYFCKFIIDPYLQDPAHSKFIEAAILDRYWAVGGVRIEDNILITMDGFENLTTAVKDIDEMEKLINGC